MKKAKLNNSGFTLVEIIVAVVIVSILFIGLVAAYRGLWTVNSVASQRDQAANLATTVMEELATKKYETITDDDINLVLPRYFDVVGTVKVTDITDGKHIEISEIQTDNYDYSVLVDITANELGKINALQYADVQYLNNKQNCIINFNSDANKFEKLDENTYYKVDITGAYKRQHENFYDRLMLQGFLNKHFNYLSRLYTDKYTTVLDYNMEHDDKLEVPNEEDYHSGITEDNYFDKLKDIVYREVYIDIVNHNTFTEVSTELVYKIDDAKERALLNELKADGTLKLDIDSLFGPYEREENQYILRNISYFDLRNIIIEYVPTACLSDNIYVTNNTASLEYGDKDFIMYFYVTDTFNEMNVLENVSVGIPNLRECTFEQDLANKLVDVYTNSDTIVSKLNLSGSLNNIINSSTKKDDKRVRMYDVSIEIDDNLGNKLYSTVESNVLR